MGVFGALTKAARGTLAPVKSNTALATRGLIQSSQAIQAVATGSAKNASTMATVTPIISGKRNLGEAQVVKLMGALGQVVADADNLKRLEPLVKEAAGAYEKAEKSRQAIAGSVAKAQQNVAIGNAKTQRDMMRGHQDAAAQVSFHQSAYSGQGFVA
jgi:hypothetical protein